MNKESIRASFKKEWHIPHLNKIKNIVENFSLTEKVIFLIFSIVLLLSTLSLLWQINKNFLVEVPDYGGSLSEGVIGSPRFVNPLLATTDSDRDLTALVYSGLLKVSSEGELLPDMADSYTISDDGLVYTFILKKNLKFHDGVGITADDVVFTIEKAKDTILKSPRKANWDGVTVQKVDDLTVQFMLKQPYSPFIQNMTLGILPKHIWKNITSEEFPFSQYNIKAVGSGPYMIDSIKYTSGGLPSEYKLKAFDKYATGKAYITTLQIKSYANEKDILSAYNNGDIESVHGISADKASSLKNSNNINMVSPLPRVFGVFFNQNVAPVFANKEVRQALDMTVNKQEIINTVLGGFGEIANGPIPSKVRGGESEPFDTEAQLDKAKALLTANGWKQNSDGVFEKKDKKASTLLAFSISTGSAPELKLAAQILQQQWQKLGARVDVKIFDIGDLNQNVIRTRKYDALLFGEIIGRDMDLFPFWHSSERIDPGLNIAMYTNLKADKILESIRKTTDIDKQKDLYDDFNQEIKKDTPAIFLYSPYFIYNIPKKIHNVTLGQLTTPAERFGEIEDWYIETNNVWKIFTRETN